MKGGGYVEEESQATAIAPTGEEGRGRAETAGRSAQAAAADPPGITSADPPRQVRIWDIEPDVLCRNHLLGEHRELHGLWNILTRDMRGYRFHPETRRWEGKLPALYRRHEALVAEMARRGYRHASPLDPSLAIGAEEQDAYVHLPEAQRRILASKPCDCFASG